MNVGFWIKKTFTTQHTVLTIDPTTGECVLSYVHPSSAQNIQRFNNINLAAEWIRRRGAIGGFKDGKRENGRNVILFIANWQVFKDGNHENSGSDWASVEDIHNDDGNNWSRLSFTARSFYHRSSI